MKDGVSKQGRGAGGMGGARARALLLLRLAGRNVLRNKRRTLLTTLLIGCGLATLVLQDGLMRGMRVALIRNATDTFLGEAQIHREGFRDNRDVELVIGDGEKVEAALRSDPGVAAYAMRVVGVGMIASAREVASVALYGVDPEQEERISKLRRAVVEGKYLTGNSPAELLIGKRLADRLEVGLGDRIVITAAQAHTGELAQELFRVSGIFTFNSKQMDEGTAYIPLARAQHLFGIPGAWHEIAVKFQSVDSAEQGSEVLRTAASAGGNRVSSWLDLMPQLRAVLEMMGYGSVISALILIGIISFSVINSMLMTIYERMFEFGVLKSIGTRPAQVAAMILLESAVLAAISIAIGLALGAAISGYFSVHGIDFRGMEYAGTSLNDPIRTIFDPAQFVTFPIYVFVLTVLAGVYPAVHAARLVPTEAMRKSL